MEKFIKPKFSKVKLNSENDSNNYGEFTLEKLEKGLGQTIGNSMRRTILSLIPGAAIFAVEIKGVTHEFQSIPNSKEDAVEFILNLKELIVEVDENLIDFDEIYEFKLNSKKGEVLASDIQVPEAFKIVNKDLLLATTNEDGAYDATFYVAYSRGFKTFEENRIFANEVLGEKQGIVPIDSNYSPVNKVNYVVEIVNPGESKEYERLVLRVETKGNAVPEKVVAQAGSILEQYYVSFKEMFEIIPVDEQFVEEVEEIEENTQLSLTIDSLNLSVRSENALKLANIKTVEELIDRPVSALREIKNLGEKSRNEIIQTIQDMGLSFKSE